MACHRELLLIAQCEKAAQQRGSLLHTFRDPLRPFFSILLASPPSALPRSIWPNRGGCCEELETRSTRDTWTREGGFAVHFSRKEIWIVKVETLRGRIENSCILMWRGCRTKGDCRFVELSICTPNLDISRETFTLHVSGLSLAKHRTISSNFPESVQWPSKSLTSAAYREFTYP